MAKKKNIDPNLVEQLAAINCSTSEIAAVIGCDRRTLQRRFAAQLENGREKGRSSLKRAMWKKAVTDENVTMMIWLSKQMCGYSDKQEQIWEMPKPLVIRSPTGETSTMQTVDDLGGGKREQIDYLGGKE